MPRSRPGTDFGEGFYMGTDPMQTKSLVENEPQPVSYALSIDFSDMPRTQIMAKTEDACARIEVVAEQVMYEDEIDGILGCQCKQRRRACGVVTRLRERYKGKGRYLSELLETPFEPSHRPMDDGRALVFSE